MQKKTPFAVVDKRRFFHGGELGIRTLGTFVHSISSAAPSTTRTTLRFRVPKDSIKKTNKCQAFAALFWLAPKKVFRLCRGAGETERPAASLPTHTPNKICAFLLTFAANGEIMEAEKYREVILCIAPCVICFATCTVSTARSCGCCFAACKVRHPRPRGRNLFFGGIPYVV